MGGGGVGVGAGITFPPLNCLHTYTLLLQIRVYYATSTSYSLRYVWPEESRKNCKEQIDGGTVMFNETWFGMFEAILESAPQFIIQLHATIVQQEQVVTIQIMTRNFLSAYFLK